MAFMLNPDAQVVFFSSVFGPSHDVTTMAKSLVASGVKFETAMYTVKATYKGNSSSVNLTTGTTSLMKHAAVFDVAEQNKKLIKQFVEGLFTTIEVTHGTGHAQVSVFWDGAMLKPDLIPAIKAIRTVTGLGLGEAKAFAETILTGKTVELQLIVTKPLAVKVLQKVGLNVVGEGAQTFAEAAQQTAEAFKDLAAAVAPKPVPQVIHLRDAKALGQKVHGTSTGSVYHTIAISEHVRVAARCAKGGAISIRTEWTDSPSGELQKLADAGVQMKSNYGSIHFDSAGVPIERTIGAFLVGVGIKWKAAVMNGAELVIGDK